MKATKVNLPRYRWPVVVWAIAFEALHIRRCSDHVWKELQDFISPSDEKNRQSVQPVQYKSPAADTQTEGGSACGSTGGCGGVVQVVKPVAVLVAVQQVSGRDRIHGYSHSRHRWDATTIINIVQTYTHRKALFKKESVFMTILFYFNLPVPPIRSKNKL
jgi:hypothetical protein